MTRLSDRRKRIVRIRTVENRLAQQKLANAQRDSQHIGTILERIMVLSRNNGLATGATDGASLAAVSGTAMRLDAARRLTAAPLEQALRQVAQCEANKMQTHLNAEGANRLLSKAQREEAAIAQEREDAARCFRFKLPLGDEL